MKYLSDLSAPDELREAGFTKCEEDSADLERKVWYRKTFDSCRSNVRIIVEVEFWLMLGDDPEASYAENCQYSWNGCFLRVIDRQMERENNQYYDEDTEQPCLVGRLELKIQTLEALKVFIADF